MSRFGGMPEWFPRELLEVVLDGSDMVEGFTRWLVEYRMIESPTTSWPWGTGCS